MYNNLGCQTIKVILHFREYSHFLQIIVISLLFLNVALALIKVKFILYFIY